MPQASQELRDKFPGDDQEALHVIENNFTVDKGFVIRPKTAGYKPTEREDDALDYLFHEWDFAVDMNGDLSK